ncbi:hypothetical protein ACSQ67_022160 [Phaseolus vulgaris]
MEINLGKLAFDVDFHPSDNLVATGLIDGDLHLYRYSPDSVPVRAVVNRLINLTESTVASGDDEGCIKWRTLSVCNLRRNTVQTRSEFSEDELLSVVLMKNGRKVVCSSQTGIIMLYSWGCFKDCSDRFIDPSSNSIDAMLKVDEDRIIGSENGIINFGIWIPYYKIQETQTNTGVVDSDDKWN